MGVCVAARGKICVCTDDDQTNGPTVKPENPAIAPCTAFCASSRQYTLSAALAGPERIM